jgi:5-methylcytosine-specific restriction endonuclease McrA
MKRYSQVCNEHGCPEIVPPGQSRCTQHRRTQDRAWEQRTHRETQPHREVYKNFQWLKLKAQVRLEEPFCRVSTCANPTTDIDHIIAVQDGGAPFDRNNLQGLCKQHHSEKTAHEVNNRRNGG